MCMIRSKHFILAFALCLWAFSCTQPIDRQLDAIEQEISSDPYTAYEELSGIPQEQLRPSSRKARYALLMSLAMDKSYIDITDDSLAQSAVKYYDRHGSERDKMLSLYSLGRVQRNAGNNTGAIISFLEAKEMAEKMGDLHYVGLCCWNIAGLYGQCNDEWSELKYYKESRDAYNIKKEINYAVYSQFGEAEVYIAKGRKHEADSLLSFIEDYARKAGDKYLLSNTLVSRGYNMMQSDAADPYVVIALLREAKETYSHQFKTIDYCTLARAYNLINDRDSVDYYISMAQWSVKTALDSVHLHNSLAVIYDGRGNYKAANEQMRQALENHNRIVYKRENQEVANTISTYNHHLAEKHMILSRQRLLSLLFSLVVVVLLLLIVVLLINNRRYIIKDKNRIIEENRQKIEEDMARIMEFSDELQEMRNKESGMARTINELISDKIAFVKKCADAYEVVRSEPRLNSRDPYSYLDKDPATIKAEEMQQFLKSLDSFRKDESLFEMLENSVNKWRDDIMVKIRKACSKDSMCKPQFSEDDFRVLMLFYAGIPDRTIAFLMDMTCSAIRTRKTRYKNRLMQSDVHDGSLFVKELTEFPTA